MLNNRKASEYLFTNLEKAKWQLRKSQKWLNAQIGNNKTMGNYQIKNWNHPLDEDWEKLLKCIQNVYYDNPLDCSNLFKI